MSWSFHFKGVRTAVIEAVKEVKGYPHQPDMPQLEAAKAFIVQELEAQDGKHVEVVGHGSKHPAGGSITGNVKIEITPLALLE